VSQQIKTHLLHGLLPQHQRPDGSVDCGTFLTEASLFELGSACKHVFTHPIHDSGHFVFHTAGGQQKLSEFLEANEALHNNTA